MSAFQFPLQMQLPSRKQAGVSLLELLVGISIGLLVSLAAIGSLTFNRVSATLINDTVSMQQDASSIMRTIGRQLKQAGAIGLQDSPGAPALSKFSYISTYQGLDPANGLSSIRGTNAALFDQLTTSFSVSPSITRSIADCRGQSPGATVTMVVNRFDVNSNNLRCTGLDLIPQPMASNIEELQLWYAIRTPAQGALPATIRYFTANQIIAPLRWDQVQAVQVCVRLRGSTTGNPTGAANTQGCLGQNIAPDGQIRRVYRKVFTLRNLQALG